jgi:hypothetical protein
MKDKDTYPIWGIVELKRGGDKVMLQITITHRGKLPEVRGTVMTDEEEIEERVKWQRAMAVMNAS